MKEIFNLCLSNSISPNQLYLLFSVNEKIRPQNINMTLELRGLYGTWITTDYKLTKKAESLLKEIDLIKVKTKYKITEEFEKNVAKYREMFPKLRLPSGKQARQGELELQKKFIKFFEIYGDYDWDTIFKATQNYLDQFEYPYNFMVASTYYIMKQDQYKNTTSLLSDDCESIIGGEERPAEHYQRTII